MKFAWTRTLIGSVSSLIVWAAHFALVYGLVGLGCDQGWDRWPVAGSNFLTVSIIAATLPALVLIAWIGRTGWRGRQAAERGGYSKDAVMRWTFMGLLTVTLAVLAFIATSMTALPSVMLPPCEA